MNRRYLVLLILIISIFTLGRWSLSFYGDELGYIPSLEIVGDIENPITLRGIPKDFNRLKVKSDGKRLKGKKLEDIILNLKPISENNNILLMGSDGLSSMIEGESLHESYLCFTGKNGWEMINENHPASSNIKHLERIVLISKDEILGEGFNIIRDNENLKHISIGELYLLQSNMKNYFEGQSQMEKDGNIYTNKVYSRQRIFSIEDLLKDYKWEKGIIMSELGDIEEINELSYLQLERNSLHYLSEDGKNKIENVKGIILDPPDRSIMDSYYDTKDILNKGEKVLFIFVDGLGYHQYEYALGKGKTPYLSSIKKAEKALTVYQPVTNAGFAAMITGKSPKENGVYSHDQREYKGNSIFQYIIDNEKAGALIQGNIGILKTEIPPILNIDRNRDGSIDDEIFQSALIEMKKGNDLLFVHFKELDFTGHSYGDLADETINILEDIDGYIDELVQKWSGKVIITSDHGMHLTEDGGNHGEFRYEDMIVPYMILEGGLDEE